jgi:hypothetical protein
LKPLRPLAPPLKSMNNFILFKGCKVISQESRSAWPIRAAREISREIERLTGRPILGSKLPYACAPHYCYYLVYADRHCLGGEVGWMVGATKRLGARELTDSADVSAASLCALSHHGVGKKTTSRFILVFLAPQHCLACFGEGKPVPSSFGYTLRYQGIR